MSVFVNVKSLAPFGTSSGIFQKFLWFRKWLHSDALADAALAWELTVQILEGRVSRVPSVP